MRFRPSWPVCARRNPLIFRAAGAARGAAVHGIEGAKELVERAKGNAAANHLSHLATFESADLFDVVYVSGGRRGLDIGISPADLVRVTGATVADIGRYPAVMPLPRQSRSGRMPATSQAKSVPVRPKPVATSSWMTRTSCSAAARAMAAAASGVWIDRKSVV